MAAATAQSTPIQCAILCRHGGDAWTGQIWTLGRVEKITPSEVVFTSGALALSFSAPSTGSGAWVNAPAGVSVPSSLAQAKRKAVLNSQGLPSRSNNVP